MWRYKFGLRFFLSFGAEVWERGELQWAPDNGREYVTSWVLEGPKTHVYLFLGYLMAAGWTPEEFSACFPTGLAASARGDGSTVSDVVEWVTTGGTLQTYAEYRSIVG